MGLAKRVSTTRNMAEVLDFFTAQDVQDNLTFLFLADALIRKSINSETQYIKVIDDLDEKNVIYYTNDKFLEVLDEYGLDGFIY